MPDTPSSRPQLGSCCDDMIRARTSVPRSLLKVTASGVIVMTIGIGPSRDGRGTAFYQEVVRFCPFCGHEVLTAVTRTSALA